MEMKKQLTPSEAILDFEKRYFDGLFKHKKGEKQQPGYSACLKAFESARAREITFERAVRILSKYAPPGVYKITERIEVAVEDVGFTGEWKMGEDSFGIAPDGYINEALDAVANALGFQDYKQ